MSAKNRLNLNSRSMGRAMASNREQQRRLHLAEEELSSGRHRTRCHINTKMHQLRAEMYKVRAKTPSLDECIKGITLCGLNAGEAPPSQVSSYYEIDKSGRLVKKRAGKRSSPNEARTNAAHLRRPHAASTAEIQERVTSFFERNRELFTPAQSEHDGCWRSQSHARDGDGGGGGSDADRRASTTAFNSHFRYVPPETPLCSSASAGAPATPHGQALVRGAKSSPNPYQSFFKPDSASRRLAQQMVVVSRKLKNIQTRREEKLREDSLLVTALEARQRARRKARQAAPPASQKPQTDTETDDTD